MATGPIVTWPATSFALGGGTAFVARNTLALVDGGDATWHAALWAAMAVDAPVDAILEALASHGLRNLPGFGIARWESADAVRVVVRGGVAIAVLTHGNERVIESGSTSTWLEDVVAGAEAVDIRIGELVDEWRWYEVLAGMVPAGRVRRAAAGDHPLAESADGWRPTVSPVVVETPVAVEAPVSVETPTPIDALDGEATLLPGDVGAMQLGPSAQPAPVPQVDEPVDAPDASEGRAGDEYDFIFGRTVARTVQGAAVLDQSDDAEQLDDPDDAAIVTATIAPVDPEATKATPIIESVPSSPLGDHDGKTITMAQLRSLRGGASPGGGPPIQALMCDAGHPNPTHVEMCRLCGRRVTGAPVQVARPPLGRLVFPGGFEVLLDRPQLIGRNPRVEGPQSGELPNLVRLDQYDGLSRRHAAIHLEGWQVLIEDLNSANGTVVTLPGRPPRRLHPGEPTILEPGAHIDLGGDVSVTFEAT